MLGHFAAREMIQNPRNWQRSESKQDENFNTFSLNRIKSEYTQKCSFQNSTFYRRATSLMKDADAQQVEPRLRYLPQHINTQCVLFPDDPFKVIWDLVILILMVYTVTVTPYNIAFLQEETLAWIILDLTVDSLFFTDVIVNCFAAYYDKQILVTQNKKIIIKYSTTWMLFDLLACLPFQLIFDQGTDWGSLLRLGRLPRLYRILKFAKFVRMIKVYKNRNKVLSCLECFSSLSVGMERLLYFVLGFCCVVHVVACLWYLTVKFNQDQPESWVLKYNLRDQEAASIYLASVYWTVMTLTTVGYGDITAANSTERVMSIIVMLGGVFFYSYTIGTISSLLGDMDRRRANLQGKLNALQELAQKYKISKEFYNKVKEAIEYDQTHISQERHQILAYLPKKLALQLNLQMNRNLIDNNSFFKDRPLKLITSIISILHPLHVKNKQIIYKKGDPSDQMYFITGGEVGFFAQLSSLDIMFYSIYTNQYFGEVEMFLNQFRFCMARGIKSCDLLAVQRDQLFKQILFYFDQLREDMIYQASTQKSILIEEKKKALREEQKNRHFARQLNIDYEFEEADGSVEDYQGKYRKIKKNLPMTTRAFLDEKVSKSEIETLRIEVHDLKEAIANLQKAMKDINILNENVAN